jgi:hypothetical protein
MSASPDPCGALGNRRPYRDRKEENGTGALAVHDSTAAALVVSLGAGGP